MLSGVGRDPAVRVPRSLSRSYVVLNSRCLCGCVFIFCGNGTITRAACLPLCGNPLQMRCMRACSLQFQRIRPSHSFRLHHSTMMSKTRPRRIWRTATAGQVLFSSLIFCWRTMANLCVTAVHVVVVLLASTALSGRPRIKRRFQSGYTREYAAAGPEHCVRACAYDAATSTSLRSGTVQAKRYYDLIPPYLAHQDDWRRLLPEWVAQAPKVRHGIVAYLVFASDA